MIEIELMEIAGLAPAMAALRLPYGKEPRTHRDFSTTPYWETGVPNQDETDTEHILRNSYRICVCKEDIALAGRLVMAGDEHAKVTRGIIAYVRITAPRYFWHEFATYKVGCECLSSTSTMHTITKGVEPGMFDADYLDSRAIADFVQNMVDVYNRETDPGKKEELFLVIKKHLPECFLQSRIFAISYQTLRRMHRQRAAHRLPEWRRFCEWVGSLPFAKELILP